MDPKILSNDFSSIAFLLHNRLSNHHHLILRDYQRYLRIIGLNFAYSLIDLNLTLLALLALNLFGKRLRIFFTKLLFNLLTIEITLNKFYKSNFKNTITPKKSFASTFITEISLCGLFSLLKILDI